MHFSQLRQEGLAYFLIWLSVSSKTYVPGSMMIATHVFESTDLSIKVSRFICINVGLHNFVLCLFVLQQRNVKI